MSGIKSLDHEVKLSFYNKRVDKNFDPEDYRIKAIYGENGSGKTAIITAIKIIQNIFLNDQYLNQDSTQLLLDELINKKTKKFSVEMEILSKYRNRQLNVYKYKLALEKT